MCCVYLGSSVVLVCRNILCDRFVVGIGRCILFSMFSMMWVCLV